MFRTYFLDATAPGNSNFNCVSSPARTSTFFVCDTSLPSRTSSAVKVYWNDFPGVSSGVAKVRRSDGVASGWPFARSRASAGRTTTTVARDGAGISAARGGAIRRSRTLAAPSRIPAGTKATLRTLGTKYGPPTNGENDPETQGLDGQQIVGQKPQVTNPQDLHPKPQNGRQHPPWKHGPRKHGDQQGRMHGKQQCRAEATPGVTRIVGTATITTISSFLMAPSFGVGTCQTQLTPFGPL